jgi:thioredoxin 1
MKRLLLCLILFSALYLGAESAPADSTTVAITMLEIGSTTCVPCKQMETVLEELRQLFGDQLIIEFHDVYKDRAIAKTWRVRAIPTQVFLDAEGNEIHRHMGFYPTEEIVKFLKTQGLEPITPAEPQDD